jgi:hydroxyacylglutathione hydrolase
MNFILEQIRTGGDRNFGYLLGDRSAGVAVAVDPSYDQDVFVERAEAQGLKITLILNTHWHVDHTNGNDRLASLTGAPVASLPGGPAQSGPTLEDGSEVKVGAYTIRVLHVPGHTPDHVLFHLANEKVAITGDLLFVGKIGGTATEEAARAEWTSLNRVLDELPDDTTIWPGHDYGCRAASTIALERLVNPFLMTEDFDAFLKIKQDWAVLKATNGLA